MTRRPANKRHRGGTSGREWFQALAETSRDIVLVRDAAGLISYCGPSVLATLGYRPKDLKGTNERELIHPFDRERREQLIARLIETNEAQPPGEMRMRSKNGSWRWFETIDTNRLDNPNVRGIVTNARDITARKATQDALIEMSFHDPLTGLPNRLLLMDRLATTLAQGTGADDVTAVLLCDLDGFSHINDTAGHTGGDRVLVEMARRLEALAEAETVARTGGAEFVVVCTGLAGVEDAGKIAARIRDIIELPLVFDDFEATVLASIGVATVTGVEARSADPAILVSNANAARQLARQQGDTRWALFDDGLLSAVTYRRELEPELRQALVAGEFVLFYQPVYDLNDATIVGVEALLRWNHPTRGLLAPEDFLELAEATGLIVPIGIWALTEACRQMADWTRSLRWRGWISVNFSARQVAQPGLAAAVRGILAASGLRSDLLRLELTETALLRIGHCALIELEAIRGLGVRIGMDDFGTGYASLTNLQQLPIDFLKIDRSFVITLKRGQNLHDHGNAIVSAIAHIGNTLDLETIAEGIATQEQAELLREYGCPYGQGFQFARPAPADDIAELLTSFDTVRVHTEATAGGH